MKYLYAALLTIILISAQPISIFSAKKAPKPLLRKSINKPIRASNKVIVKYKNKKKVSAASKKSLFKNRKLIKGGAVELKLKSSQNVTQVINRLEKDPNVEYVEPNYLRKASLQPNDTYYSLQWGLSKMQAPAGWNIETGASNTVVIAVVDTGVDLTHPDLVGKILPGKDFANNDSTAQDDNGHGTHVAGIAAASTNNGLGVAGVSWNAKIMPIKVLDSYGSGYDSWVANGIREAVNRGANIINLSLGGPGYSETLKQATDYAAANNVLVIAAAGNTGSSVVAYPAGNPGVLGVGATDQNDKIASFSSYNSTVDVSAPGVGIASTLWYRGSHQYAYMSGTSMATPNVAGVAALIKSRWPAYSASQIGSRLIDYSDDLGSPGRDNYFGYGRVNVYKALNSSSRSNISISIAANAKRIRTGRKVIIRGRIRPKASGKALLRYKKKGKGWRSLKRFRVKGSIYKTSVRLNSPNRYVFAVRYAGSSSRAMVIYAAGKRVKSKAKSKVSINASSKRVKRGRAFRIYGKLKLKGRRYVTLKYRKAGSKKWRSLSKVRVRKRIYKTKVKINNLGNYIFAVKTGGHRSRSMVIIGI